MTIAFKFNNTSPNLLSIDDENFAEIYEVTPDALSMRMVFKIKLNGQVDPMQCQKVLVTVKDVTQETLLSSNNVNSSIEIKNNFIPKELIAKDAATNDSKLIADQQFGQVHNSEKSFSSTAAFNSLLENSNKAKSSKKQNFILTHTVYVNEKIKNSLKNQYQTTNLLVFPQIAISQQNRLLPSEFSLDQEANIKNSKINLISPTQCFSQYSDSFLIDEEKKFFSKKLIDYLIHDVEKLDKQNYERMTFYVPVKSAQYLNTVEVSTDISIPIFYKNSRLIVQLNLFFDRDFPEETVSTFLDINNLFSVFNVVLDEPQIVKNEIVKNSLSNTSIISYLYPKGNDRNKILGYNVYQRSLDDNEKLNFAFVSQMQGSSQGSLANIVDINSDLKSVIRMIPVTSLGESNVFSDVIVGKKSVFKERDLTIIIYQKETSAIEIDIKGISNDAKSLKIFRRDCTTSANRPFERITTISKSIPSVTSRDTSIIFGHLYEYYVQTYDTNGNLLQTSDVKPIKSSIISKSFVDVSVTNIRTVNDTVSFDISFQDLREKSLSNVQNISNSATQINQGDSSQLTVERTNLDSFPVSVIYKVTRTDTATSETVTFPLIIDNTGGTANTSVTPETNGDIIQSNTTLFSDSESSRKQNNIPGLIPGRVYVYDVYAYTKNSAVVNNNLIITGENNNKTWFYKPSKWLEDQVVNTGILYAESEQGDLLTMENDLLLSNPIGLIASHEVTLPTDEKSFDLQPTAFRISRSLIRIAWDCPNKNYDSFIVYKIINGKKQFLGKTCKEYIHHKLSPEDLGNVYYQVTPLDLDYKFRKTFYTNDLLIKEDLSFKEPIWQ